MTTLNLPDPANSSKAVRWEGVRCRFTMGGVRCRFGEASEAETQAEGG
jgi:hypothetical protein